MKNLMTLSILLSAGSEVKEARCIPSEGVHRDMRSVYNQLTLLANGTDNYIESSVGLLTVPVLFMHHSLNFHKHL